MIDIVRSDDDIYFPLREPRTFRHHGTTRPPRRGPTAIPAPCAALIALRHWRSMGGGRVYLLRVRITPGFSPLVEGVTFSDDGDDATEAFLYIVIRRDYVENAR